MDLGMFFEPACEKAKLQADKKLEKERQETQEARKATKPNAIANPYLKNTIFELWRAELGNFDFLLNLYLKNNNFELLAGWGRKSGFSIKSLFGKY